MNRAVIVAFSLGALLAPVTAQADAIGIEVINATYSANLNVTLSPGHGGGTTTATAQGSSSVSESLDLLHPVTVIDPSDGSVVDSYTLEMKASASADWLAVAVNLRQQSFNDWTAQASSDFDLTFSPVADGTAPFEVAVLPSGEYGSGFGALVDETTQQELWRFSFGSDFGGCDGCRVAINQGGIQSFDWGPFALPTNLSTGDVYNLHLTASTLNLAVGTFSTVQVSGLIPVAEPSSLLLLGTGLITLSTFRRRVVRRASNPLRLLGA